jgi:hypothetical protein
MTKRSAIILSIVGVIVVAVIAVTTLLIIKSIVKKGPDVATIVNKNAVLKPDVSQNFGACTLLSKTTIESALGSVASTLHGPDNEGVGTIGSGDTAQTCVYPFLSDGSFATNGFNLDNSFNVLVYEYKNSSNKTSDRERIGSVSVSGLGDKAAYVTTMGDSNNPNSFSLTVYSGLKYFTYTINQPTASTTFSSDSAKSALVTIANSVKY